MSLETLRNKFKKHYFPNYICLILFVGITIFGVLIYNSSEASSYNRNTTNKIKPVAIEGMYKVNMEDEWIPFKDYSDISMNNNMLIIKGHLKQNIPHGQNLFVYSEKISVEIFLDGISIFKDYDQINNKWDIINTPGITTDNEITIIMKNNRNTVFKTEFNELLKRLSYGESYDFLQKQIIHNLGHLVICILIFIIGIATLFLVIALRFLGIPALAGHEACGMILITGASCLFINYDYITLIFNNALIVNIVDFVLQMLIGEYLIMYLTVFVKTKIYKKIANILVSLWTGMILVYMLLRLLNLINQSQFEVVAATVVVITITIEICFMVNDFNHSNNKSKKYIFYSGAILAFFTVVEVIHFCITHVFLVFIFKAGLFIYTIIQVAILMRYSKDGIIQSRRVKEIEKQMIQNKVEIMMSQIKPHFLYNTLGTIKALCLKDVNTARTAIDYFSKYLRANMNSISEKESIPFVNELSHVKSYLYIEKLRFDDLLNIEYEIETENFKCPSLLLQTMVENAVKHGICNKVGGGTLLIKSYETEQSNIIQVIDDGIGFDFDYKVDDSERAHIGIENTKNRLREMCNGKLDIISEIGKGTTVTIEIPKGVEADECNSSR